MENNVNIAKYASYFHDGSVIDIQHYEGEILISMESSEISQEDLKDDITLSEQNTLKGVLHLERIEAIWLDGKSHQGKLQMLADTGGILKFQVSDKKTNLFLEWINYPPKKVIEKFSDIEISASNIFWENVPNLYDPFGKN